MVAVAVPARVNQSAESTALTVTVYYLASAVSVAKSNLILGVVLVGIVIKPGLALSGV